MTFLQQEKGVCVIENLYSTVLSLNNSGSHQLVTGDLTNSFASFSSALSVLKQCAIREGVPSSSVSYISQQSPVRQSSGGLVYAFATSPPRGTPYSSRRSGSSRNIMANVVEDEALLRKSGNFVHAQPIELHHCVCGEQDSILVAEEQRVVCVLSCCVVYNLALCCHMHALRLMTTNGDSRIMLNRAGRLYCHAQTLLHCHSNHSLLLELSIFNNLGHVLFHQGHKVYAKANFEILFNAILCIKKATTASNQDILSSVSQLHGIARKQVVDAMDGFLSNIFYYCMQSHEIAPAA